MRWLVMCLLVSLAVLLVVAGAVARHIWVHHTRLHREPASRTDAPHEADLEP